MIDHTTFDNFLLHLINGNKRACQDIVQNLLDKDCPVEIIYTNLFQGALYVVGDLWEKNKISVATEHMSTALVETLMIHLQPKLFTTLRVGKKAVIACVAKEFHQVGAKMIADMFEMHGWDGYFIGANTPAEELNRFIAEQKPDVIGLSLSIYFNINELKDSLAKMRQQFPETPVIVGGQAFRWGGDEIVEQFSNVRLLKNVPDLKNYIQSA